MNHKNFLFPLIFFIYCDYSDCRQRCGLSSANVTKCNATDDCTAQHNQENDCTNCKTRHCHCWTEKTTWAYGKVSTRFVGGGQILLGIRRFTNGQISHSHGPTTSRQNHPSFSPIGNRIVFHCMVVHGVRPFAIKATVLSLASLHLIYAGL